MPSNCKRFSIDLENRIYDDIAIRFNPRFDDEESQHPVVVRTLSHLNKTEKTEYSPFNRGQSFEIIILILETHLKVIIFLF